MDAQTQKVISGIAQVVVREGLKSDTGLLDLINYYARLRKGGNGELSVKLLNGKLKIRGITYIAPD